MEEQEEEQHLDLSATAKPSPLPPSCVRVPPSSPPTFSLSARISSRNHVIPAKTGREIAWHSLQGRIVGAEEATSFRTVGIGCLGSEEVLAWEMLEPMQRVLIVAVAAAAAAFDESKRAKEVARLKRSVEIRDKLLLCMQQKLEDLLCEHMYPLKVPSMNDSYHGDDNHGSDEECVKWKEPQCRTENSHGIPSEMVPSSFDANMFNERKDAFEAIPCINDTFKSSQLTTIEQEERRMSDLSDLFSSAASSVDIQMSVLAEQQEKYNLRKECEEKEATINELNAVLLEYNAAESRRISELEDIIRRKNLVNTKLRKDLVYLEQKVIQLTRLRRKSSTATQSNLNRMQLPLMLNNILYDMSSSNPSSSDSDSSDNGKRDNLLGEDTMPVQSIVTSNNERSLNTFSGSTESSLKQQTKNILKENRDTNMTSTATMLNAKGSSSSGYNKKSKQRDYQEPKRDVSQISLSKHSFTYRKRH